MKTIKVSEATNIQLDWLVAKCEGANVRVRRGDDGKKCISVLHAISCPENKPGCAVAHFNAVTFCPSTDWSQGGPIIERECIELLNNTSFSGGWLARLWIEEKSDILIMGKYGAYCPTPLIAAMRCYIANKLGETVEVPEEL